MSSRVLRLSCGSFKIAMKALGSDAECKTVTIGDPVATIGLKLGHGAQKCVRELQR